MIDGKRFGHYTRGLKCNAKCYGKCNARCNEEVALTLFITPNYTQGVMRESLSDKVLRCLLHLLHFFYIYPLYMDHRG